MFHPFTASGGEIPTDPTDRCPRTLDPWVALAIAASVTTSIRLGASAAGPLEHDPIAPAKTIMSLEHLSDGRVVFGVGFGWNAEELADHDGFAEHAAHRTARIPRKSPREVLGYIERLAATLDR
ncbi:alkanesulfonate monooxygenase SsuD/methylene tetrahydromethanopterin reductase-like flavin-dependent oxidoreductase (luciferase family) [Rhodococcus sp. 27YEA15]